MRKVRRSIRRRRRRIVVIVKGSGFGLVGKPAGISRREHRTNQDVRDIVQDHPGLSNTKPTYVLWAPPENI